ncbi:hypothetical protein QWZ13_10480 [Reinekea marina]|uniref:Uncharacterized protein n=1 Tax=Reinekea marina TaxID=1310421 RepID=A0ABV7WM64_9GAMM|nr:hypothetical protein [Reinekea marina]MDN3649337.1 hypothetical protein [Reinekea marina]
MNFPSFVSFEVTDVEHGYPYAIAWSLPDGQYKSVLVKPEPEWLIDWEAGNLPIDAPSMQDVIDKGETVVDILKEWDLDFEDGEIYCQDPILAQYCFDLLFEAYDKECDFDIISEYDLYKHLDSFDVDDQRRWIMDTEGLSANLCEDVVRTMLFLNARLESSHQEEDEHE